MLMWVVVHMARSQAAAEEICECLTKDGLLVGLHPVYRAVASHDNYYEVRVLESEMREARSILLERGL
jgi:hypothetical protein